MKEYTEEEKKGEALISGIEESERRLSSINETAMNIDELQNGIASLISTSLSRESITKLYDEIDELPTPIKVQSKIKLLKISSDIYIQMAKIKAELEKESEHTEKQITLQSMPMEQFVEEVTNFE